MELVDITRTFPGVDGTTKTVINNLRLSVGEGKVVTLVGHSGCGKTTLLKIIAGIVEPDSGYIVYGDGRTGAINNSRVVSRPRTGFVFQDVQLLPWKSVLQNVCLGLIPQRLSKDQANARAFEALDLVGLSAEANMAPYMLSGGMQQRVGIARAIAIQPELLLLDEPFGQLDSFTRRELQSDFNKLCERLAITTMFVTHDVEEAILISDQIVVMEANTGRIVEVVENPIQRPRDNCDVRALDDGNRVYNHVQQLLGR